MSSQSQAKPRLLDCVRMLAGTLPAMLSTVVGRWVRGPRQPSWSWRLELLVAATRRTWSLLSKIGVVRWRNVGNALSPLVTGSLKAIDVESPVRGTWMRHDERRQRVLLYFHGGGFVFGSIRTHGAVISAIAQACEADAFVPDYRLAPEHPYPAARDDALAAYSYLREEGVDAADIVLAGDSAGGNLVLTTLLALRDRGEPLPAAGVAISPWVDLSCSGASFERNADFDFVGKEHCELAAGHYLAGHDARSPEVSPLFAELGGLPPLLVHAGGAETLLDQIQDFVARAEEAGAAIQSTVAPEMVHVWHMHTGATPRAQEAIDEIAEFVGQHT